MENITQIPECPTSFDGIPVEKDSKLHLTEELVRDIREYMKQLNKAHFRVHSIRVVQAVVGYVVTPL